MTFCESCGPESSNEISSSTHEPFGRNLRSLSEVLSHLVSHVKYPHVYRILSRGLGTFQFLPIAYGAVQFLRVLITMFLNFRWEGNSTGKKWAE